MRVIELYRITVPNGEGKLHLYFYFQNIADQQVNNDLGDKTGKNPENISETDINSYLNVDRQLGNYVNIVVNIIRLLVDHFGGFPSAQAPLTRLDIVFEFVTSSQFGVTDDLSHRRLYIGIKDTDRKRFQKSVYHEALHLIAKYHHDEQILIEQLKETISNYEKSTSFDQHKYQAKFGSIIKSLVKSVKKPSDKESIEHIASSLNKTASKFFTLFCWKISQYCYRHSTCYHIHRARHKF